MRNTILTAAPVLKSGRSGTEVSLKRYRYTGKERDEESGLYYHRARYYIPWLCRWASTEPLNSLWYNSLYINYENIENREDLNNALQAKYPDLSSYSYCINNPIIFNDLDGKDARVTVEGDTITISTIVYLFQAGEDKKVINSDQNKESYDYLSEKAKEFNDFLAQNPQLTNGKYFDESTGKEYNIKIDLTYKVATGDVLNSRIPGEGNNIMFLQPLGDFRPVAGSDVEVVLDEHGRRTREYTGNKLTGTLARLNTDRSYYSDGETAVHETFHLLGLTDRYFENLPGQPAMPGFKGDIMERGTQMSQQHWRNWGKTILSKEQSEFILKYQVDTKVDNNGKTIIDDK